MEVRPFWSQDTEIAEWGGSPEENSKMFAGEGV